MTSWTFPSSTGSATKDWDIIAAVYIYIHLILLFSTMLFTICTFNGCTSHSLYDSTSSLTKLLSVHVTPYCYTFTAWPLIGYLFYTTPSGYSGVHGTVPLNLFIFDQMLHCLYDLYIWNTSTPPSAEENGLVDTELWDIKLSSSILNSIE